MLVLLVRYTVGLSLTLLGLSVSGCGGRSQSEPEPGCGVSTPIPLRDGSPSGFERCADGSIHRTSVVAPGAYPDRGEACAYDDYPASECVVDADCTEHPNGLCQNIGGDGGLCGCKYVCESDADCAWGASLGESLFCMPVEVWDRPDVRSFGQCTSAGCSTDADCPSGECGLGFEHSGCGSSARLACRTPEDDCRSDADCGGSDQCNVWFGSSTWSCENSGCN